MAKRPKFQASLQSDGTLELLMYDDIGEDFWSYDGGITAKTVRQQLDASPNAQRISVRIDSDGGGAFDGIAIYNVLRAQKKPIDVFVDGLAASAASIIAMAGDTITMGVNTCMMIHNAAAMVYGTATELRSTADRLDTVSDAIAQTYVQKTGKSAGEVKALLDAETWMTAQECLDEKFCTAIATEIAPNVEALATRRLKIAARFHPNREPEAKTKLPVQNAACACGCKNCAASNCAGCTVSDCDDLNCTDCPMQASAKAKAAVPPKRVRNSGECACACSSCEDGNCDTCTNKDCDDPNCEDCPMQQDNAARAERERLRLELQFMTLKAAS